jgi:hypothetical protein
MKRRVEGLTDFTGWKLNKVHTMTC